MTQDLCRAEFEDWLEYQNDNEQAYACDYWRVWQAAWNAKPATEHNPADTSQNIEWTGAAE